MLAKFGLARWIFDGRLGLVGAAMALTVAAAIAPSTAAPAKSTGTILQYDENGRVIGRVRRDFDPQPTAPAPQPNAPAAEIPVSEAVSASRPAFVPGEILAVSDAPDFAGRARGIGFPVLQRAQLASLDLTIYRLRTPAGLVATDALPTFRTAFPAATADVNGLVYPAAGLRGWDALGMVGWPQRQSRCGQGQSIGMIDTGVDAAHEVFASGRLVQRSFLPADRIAASPEHGTAVAALLVGNSSTGFESLLPGAELYAGNIFEETETGQAVGNVFALVGAFDWMVETRVDVLNLSLETGKNDILSVALDKAIEHGIAITAAAGNGGATARPAYPAAHPEVLAVTAIDPELQAYRHANHGNYIDFAAPGVSLWTATPGGGQFQSGTSFAVPFLTAAVAMQMASGAQPTAEGLRQRLSSTVRDLGVPGKDDVYGWGLLSFRPDCG